LPIFEENSVTRGEDMSWKIIRGKSEDEGFESKNNLIQRKHPDLIIRGKRETYNHKPIIRGKRESESFESQDTFIQRKNTSPIIRGKRDSDSFAPIIRGKQESVLPVFDENFATTSKVHRKPIIRGKREGEGLESQNALILTDQQDLIIRGKRDTDSYKPIIRGKREDFLPIFGENSGIHGDNYRKPIIKGKREGEVLESQDAFLLTDQQDSIIRGKRDTESYTHIIRGKREDFLPIFEDDSGIQGENYTRPIIRGKREEEGLESQNVFNLTGQKDSIIRGKRERDSYTPIIRGKRESF